MANIFIVPADVFLHILNYLDIHDRIAFALTCRISRQICVDVKVFRKMDLSRCRISTMQRSELNKFIRDKQLTQHIRELNISNLRVLNWQMDDQLEEFVISICQNLEALHVLDCGMSLQRLHRILKQAPKLTSLSWSLWDFTSEDMEFLMNSIESSEGISLKNIKHLHLEILCLVPHIQIAKYFVLSCCRDLEELEIYTCWLDSVYISERSLPLLLDYFIPGFPQLSDVLQHLHSLVVVAWGALKIENYGVTYGDMLYDFIFSVVRRKSTSTKWRKLCTFPLIGTSKKQLTDLMHLLHPQDFQSVEAIALDATLSANTVDEVKTLLRRIGDNTVRSLQLHLPRYSNLIVEFCDPMSRVGGRSLKFLCLSVCPPEKQNVFIHHMFSNCVNITELDLLGCNFEKDICKPLSELKHLAKVQLMECAISSKYYCGNEAETSQADLLTFVENCKNITHLDVRGCVSYHMNFVCRLTDGDMLALAKLRKLRSLTLDNISGITEWTFLRSILEHCKFLTMLRIAARSHNKFNANHVSILMESAKFLKHLAIHVSMPILGKVFFWNLLSHAKNLERLCFRCGYPAFPSIPAAVETLKSLPRLHVLHLHSANIENVEAFHSQMKRMLEEKESDCRFSFEIVTGNRRRTWINQQNGYSLISKKALPLNEAELCDMTPILDNPRF